MFLLLTSYRISEALNFLSVSFGGFRIGILLGGKTNQLVSRLFDLSEIDFFSLAVNFHDGRVLSSKNEYFAGFYSLFRVVVGNLSS